MPENNSPEVDWADPPNPSGRPSLQDRLLPLMEQPGRWARLGEFSASYASVLSHKQELYSIPDGRWEFTGRRESCPPGRAILYARYLGPES